MATAFGTIAYASFLFWEKFIEVPEIEILYEPDKIPDLHRPQYDIFDERGKFARRQYCIVVIRNKGEKVAKNCRASIRRVKSEEGCFAFSKEPKPLQWQHAQFDQPRDIAPSGMETLLFAFAQENYAVEILAPWCKYEKENAHIRAWAATPRTNSEIQPRWHLQDGFCQGNFEVELTVYVENGKPVSAKFELRISERWSNLQMKRLN